MSGTLKKLTGMMTMMRSPLALLVALLPLSVSAQVVYQCTDASGGKVISNSRVGQNCKSITSAPEVALGMPREKVISVAGNPLRKNISKKQGLVRELWRYDGGNVFVFENGVVVEILSAE
ncbi:MAG: DUF4124 domain-containing protein [Azonexus sp.]|nr:DUF4124 domain-containing protein [Azonexus sp.]